MGWDWATCIVYVKEKSQKGFHISLGVYLCIVLLVDKQCCNTFKYLFAHLHQWTCVRIIYSCHVGFTCHHDPFKKKMIGFKVIIKDPWDYIRLHRSLCQNKILNKSHIGLGNSWPSSPQWKGLGLSRQVFILIFNYGPPNICKEEVQFLYQKFWSELYMWFVQEGQGCRFLILNGFLIFHDIILFALVGVAFVNSWVSWGSDWPFWFFFWVVFITHVPFI